MTKSFRNFLVLFFIGFAVYANSLHSPFMLDDFSFMVQFKQSTILQHFGPAPEHTYYRPLAFILPQINYLLFKNNPVGYHVSNLLMLIIAAWCLVLMMSTLMTEGLALIVGILFLIHPLDGMMVNYITANVFAGQMIAICLSLYYLSHFEQRVTRHPERSEGSHKELIPSEILRYAQNDRLKMCIWFIIALLCHETSFMLPFYGIVLCLIQGNDIKGAWNRTRWLWLMLVGYMVLRSFCVPFTHSLFHSVATTGLSWDQSFASILSLLAWYIQKLFIPLDIFLMWSLPFVRHNSWDWVTAFMGVAVLIVFLLRRLRAVQPKIVLFMTWFFVGLLPIFLGAFATPNMGALLEPHWFFPASIGLYAAVVLSASYFIKPVMVQKTFFLVMGIFLMLAAWGNNRLWSDETNFYEQWLAQDPDCKAVHYFLGALYERQMQYDKARQQFQQSILGRSKDWMVYVYLGEIDLKQGRLEDAGKNFQLAYDHDPRQTNVLNGLGVVEFQSKKYDRAMEWFERAVEVSPLNLEPRMNLALTYRLMGDIPKALAACQETLRIAPDFAPAVHLLEKLNNTSS